MKISKSNFKVRPVSRGIGYGKALVIHGDRNNFYKIKLTKKETTSEVKRFERALQTSIKQLDKLTRSKKGFPSSAADIFETHKIIISDTTLQEKIVHEIKSNSVNAEWAVKCVFDEYISHFKAINNKHIREKYIDLNDISDRLLKSLKPPKHQRKLPSRTIIVIKELTPSMLIELSKNDLSGIITERGGWTSHTSIIARELNIPAVTGIRKALQRFDDGDDVLIDAFKGIVSINPSARKINSLKNSNDSLKIPAVAGSSTAPFPKTIDGHKITVRCNADKLTDYSEAETSGARGIGLYRTELLVSESNLFPSENIQYNLYSDVAKKTGEHGVRIRTFDVGPEVFSEKFSEPEKNPALGLRAIRLGFAYPELYRKQIRALLRASVFGKITIILPMVSGLDEIRKFKLYLDRERSTLSKKGLKFGSPNIGVMIEIPSAVFMIDQIMKEVDSVCLGTNDLVQYLTAVDRDNALVSDWFQTLHPANLKAIKNVVTAGQANNKTVLICGEMAGSPFYIPLLVGLGATDLSMNINSIANVRQLISGIAYEETVELANRALQLSTPSEINALLKQQIISKWRHLYDPVFDFSI